MSTGNVAQNLGGSSAHSLFPHGVVGATLKKFAFGCCVRPGRELWFTRLDQTWVQILAEPLTSCPGPGSSSLQPACLRFPCQLLVGLTPGWALEVH